ncbi:3'-5' exoribonuclease [Variovorax sp. PAMC26660]|uniref:3'-5' exoribonuclease n=1 Tax=Variovorax sp. PAMC26660 TaxID=2762322 RepID=UPI00164E2DA2|nr:3'-5' exoribonuclease [Variovorax sp. PAMC26660]QNK67833.1 hypothetical protein H7F35_32705 [Variovorax sp. PAMC26660]
MRIWIDTEFNGHEGELISLALVDEDGASFYRYVHCAEPEPWVAANVLPVLGLYSLAPERKAPASRQPSNVWTLAYLQRALAQWLEVYESIHLVADWPEDIAHFCRLLITGPGTRLDTPPLTMEIRRDLDAESLVPHNALEDARAMRAVHLAYEKAGCL